MRGLVLAGGTGSRLRPLTYTSAKQLIPVANKPILFYGIEALASAGIRDIVVIVGDTGEEVRRALGDGSALGVSVRYVDQEAPLGLAHAVKIAEAELSGEDFCMFLGDNLLQGGVRDLVEEYERVRPDAMILLAEVANPSEFGVASLDAEGRVVRLVEKPKNPPSNLALVGVYLFTPAIFEVLPHLRPSWRNELEITDAIQLMIDRGMHVHSQVVRGWWKDTGKPEDVLEANRLVLDAWASAWVSPEARVVESRIEGRVRIEADAVVERSVIRGPAVVGSGAEVRDAFVGPYTSIGPRAVVEASEVQNTIVLDDAVLRGVLGVEGSLIGRGAVVERESRLLPRGMRLVLGDRSRVVLP